MTGKVTKLNAELARKTLKTKVFNLKGPAPVTTAKNQLMPAAAMTDLKSFTLWFFRLHKKVNV